MKRYIAAAAILCMLFISGCTHSGDEAAKTADEAASAALDTVLGYVPAEVSAPDWLESIWGWDTYGDILWLGVQGTGGDLLAASYDTLSGEWQSFLLETNEMHNPVPLCLSFSGDSLWVLLKESLTEADIENGRTLDGLGYYIISAALNEEDSKCSRIPFEGDSGTEGSGAIICSVLALDTDRALLTTHSAAYLIGADGSMQGSCDLPVVGEISQVRVNDKRYIRTDDGYAELDESGVKLGGYVSVRNKGFFSSNMGSFLTTEKKALYYVDPVSCDRTEVFKWIDVALSYSELGGDKVLENSEGEFFYPASSGIIKITPMQMQSKQTLTMVCFSNSGDEMSQYQTFADELMDAVVRFNNTDPEFRVEIKPVVYDSEAERDRLMIELATSDEADIIDTSLLPENAIKDGLLVDMMPYIDADAELDRDDFIQPLLNSMLKNGALYEYTDRFTLLTMTARRDTFTGREAWTTDYIRELKAQRTDLECLARDHMLDSFILASTAEFVDWDKMTCSFDSAAFKNWLIFLKEQPSTIELYESPVLFQINTDFAYDAGLWARIMTQANDYVVTGFPETSGTGSYFAKLSGPFDADAPSNGTNTRLGILASGKHIDGSWRFVRMLMTGKSDAGIAKGIPVMKERFEQAVNTALAKRNGSLAGVDEFTEDDAQLLREQVYNTQKLVRNDEALLTIIRSETAAYFENQKSVEETAARIQNRVSLYLAEQG